MTVTSVDQSITFGSLPKIEGVWIRKTIFGFLIVALIILEGCSAGDAIPAAAAKSPPVTAGDEPPAADPTQFDFRSLVFDFRF